jgi:hypothetical protein
VRPNFRQRRIVAFTAAWGYAKSAPVALRCGDLEHAFRNDVEALGGRVESALNNFHRIATPSPVPRRPRPRWHRLEQTLPWL